jgi:transposase
MAGGEGTDMRCGFDRLAERVSAVISQDPLSGHLFVFASRRCERLKILSWDRDGYVLCYKRLEAGVFKLPRVKEGVRSVELRASELAMILDGIDMTKLKRTPRYRRTNASNKRRSQANLSVARCGITQKFLCEKFRCQTGLAFCENGGREISVRGLRARS